MASVTYLEFISSLTGTFKWRYFTVWFIESKKHLNYLVLCGYFYSITCNQRKCETERQSGIRDMQTFPISFIFILRFAFQNSCLLHSSLKIRNFEKGIRRLAAHSQKADLTLDIWKRKKIWLHLTLFRMGIFGAAHGCGGSKQASPP